MKREQGDPRGEDGGSGTTFDVRCPVCRVVFPVRSTQAERAMSARCPKGHDVPLVQAS